MKLISFFPSQLPHTVVTASSENQHFPAENLKHEFRAKEWRSAGHFLITEENGGGVVENGQGPKPLEIPPGAYTPEELAVELLNALEAATETPFQVTFSRESGRWSISSDNEFALEGPFLAVIGFDPVSGESSYTGPRVALHTEEWAIFDFKTVHLIDTVALLWEVDNYRLTPEAEIFIEANATNTWESPAFRRKLTFNNDALLAHTFCLEAFRYWRVVIRDPQNTYGYVHLGSVLLGKSDEALIRTSTGFSFQLADGSKVFKTEFGQTYADKFPKLKVLDISFDLLELEEVRQLVRIFKQVGSTAPVLIFLDPEEAVLTNDFWIYGKLPGALGLRHQVQAYFNNSLSIREGN